MRVRKTYNGYTLYMTDTEFEALKRLCSQGLESIKLLTNEEFKEKFNHREKLGLSKLRRRKEWNIDNDL